MSVPKAGSRAMTLLEIAISVTFLGLLLILVFGLYSLGLRSWNQQDVRSDLLRSLRRGNRELRNSVSHSNLGGCSVKGGNLSLISSLDDQGKDNFGPNGELRWVAWEVFTLRGQELRRHRLPWVGDPQNGAQPTTVETVLGEDYFAATVNEGRTVAKNVENIEFELLSDKSLLQVQWDFLLPSRRNPKGERLNSRSVYRFRN